VFGDERKETDSSNFKSPTKQKKRKRRDSTTPSPSKQRRHERNSSPPRYLGSFQALISIKKTEKGKLVETNQNAKILMYETFEEFKAYLNENFPDITGHAFETKYRASVKGKLILLDSLSWEIVKALGSDPKKSPVIEVTVLGKPKRSQVSF